jgi:DNA-binding transcriptional LysR family regulator
LGTPQDFADVILQQLLVHFAASHPDVQLEIKAGRNFELAADVASGKLDVAVAFAASHAPGAERIATVPTVWLGCAPMLARTDSAASVPLTVFDGPCLFRDMAIDALSRAGIPWRLTMTTPSLASLWCAMQAGLGVTVRTLFGVPKRLAVLTGAPALGPIDIVLHRASRCSDDAHALADLLQDSIRTHYAAQSR